MQIEKTMEQIQRISLKAIFQRDGKVLCLQDPKGKWELPGGRMEFGETMEDALRRELKEEVGFEKVVINPTPISAWTFVWHGADKEIQFVLIAYECSSDEMPIKEYAEWVECGWFSFEEIESLTMSDGYKEAVRNYKASHFRV